MTRALAHREGIRTEDDLLVGFKWIASRIDEAGPAELPVRLRGVARLSEGDCTSATRTPRVASLLFAELAATVKDRKQTVLEYLDDLYIDVGHHGERLVTKTYEGREGHAKIKTMMEAFRTRPPREIGGLALSEVCDYQAHEIRSLGRPEPTRPLPQSVGRPAHLPRRPPRLPVRRAARPGPSRRSSSTSSPGPTSMARIICPRRSWKPSNLLDRMASDLDRYVEESLKG